MEGEKLLISGIVNRMKSHLRVGAKKKKDKRAP